MSLWQTDDELFELVRAELFVAVVGDVMDQHGLTTQFLPREIKPIRADMVMIGRAMPVVEADIETLAADDPLREKAFGLMFDALDDLKRNEVYICSGAAPTYALWGEMMSTRALQLGAVGAVLDGCYRDTSAVLALNFPTFGLGSYAQDQGVRGRVVDFRVAIEFADVTIKPGDVVFGDRDGVCIIPKDEEKAIFEAALEKARGEKLVKKALQEGMSAVAAWEKFGIM